MRYFVIADIEGVAGIDDRTVRVAGEALAGPNDDLRRVI